MKRKFIFILFSILFLTSGCFGKNNEEQDEIKIDNVTDYYINYYSSLLERVYKESYAGYLYSNPSGSIETFKDHFKSPKNLYEFRDITGDGIEEFILVTDESESSDDFLRAKSIDIYTIDKDTKIISTYLRGEYWDNLYFNKSKNIYLSKYNLDDTIHNKPNNYSTNTVVYNIMEFNDDNNYYIYLNKLQHNTVRDIYLYSYKNYELWTRNDLENGNISSEEARKYLSDLKEIKFNLNDMSEIFNKTYEDSMLIEIDKKMKGNSDFNNSNLKCTSTDVDKIIKTLEQGGTVRINLDGDIKIDKQEGNQFYNKEYPFFLEYTISCGSYFRTIRISHK